MINIMEEKKNREYPDLIAWELTNECNFNCLHCYNSGSGVVREEFDLETAYKMCEDLAEMKVKNVVLSGGEVLMSDIWKPVAKKLIELGVRPGLLSNGWFFTPELFQEMKDTGIDWIGFSIDGLKETHDHTRQEGSFDRIMEALDLIKDEDFFVSINTTVHRNNINELPELHDIMNKKGVTAWQVQLAVTEGNLEGDKNSLMIDPKDMDTIIDFVYDRYKTSETRMLLGDCIGHYNEKEIEIRSVNTIEEYGCYSFVNGCQAGIRVLGIKANGDITGCIALSKDYYIAGNIYKRNIKDIWNDENSFSWNKTFDTSQMKGVCGSCIYGEYCRSGCPSLRYDKDFNVIENKHCSYNAAIREKVTEIEQETSLNVLLEEKNEAVEYKNKFLIDVIDQRIELVDKQ